MGWIQAVMAGLVVTVIGLGVRGRYPLGDDYSASRRQEVLEEWGDDTSRRCFPALFSFGSSVADTGTQAVVFPGQITRRPPYGSTFFGKPAGRYSDGRIHIDFWASALRVPFLDPFLESVGSDFRRGVNFASSGATVCNSTVLSPFSLSVQLYQFQQFKRDVVALRRAKACSRNSLKVPLEEDFRNGLYVIAIGGNDILIWSTIEQRPFEEVELLVPKVSTELLRVVEALYAEGARHILVEDVFPQGCTPYFLTLLASRYPDQFDAIGCLKPINDLVQLHNYLLKMGVSELRKQLPDASISFVDTYSRRYSIMVNHDQFGFEEPIKACCGSGGDYNFGVDCPCSYSKMDDGILVTGSSCPNVSNHVVWDGLHYTEAFNRVTMQGILSGNYFEPHFDLIRNGCTLAEI